MTSVKCMQPASRDAGARELSGVLSAPGQVGYPPTMNTDLSFGYTSAGYHSAEVASGSHEADGCASARFAGATSRGLSGKNRNTAQKAQAGYYARCTIATHVALLPSFEVGKVGELKAKGVDLRK